MVHVRWQVPGTHLPKGKTPGTEHKRVKEGRGPEPQTRKQAKTVHSQPVGGLGRSSFLSLREGRFSCPRWRPGSVLFRPQGRCFMTGTVPPTGSLLRPQACRSQEAPHPNYSSQQGAWASQKQPSPPPPPTTFSCARPRTHRRWRCNKEQNPINPKTGQVRGKSHIVSYPPRVTIPSELRAQNSPRPADRGEVEGL